MQDAILVTLAMPQELLLHHTDAHSRAAPHWINLAMPDTMTIATQGHCRSLQVVGAAAHSIEQAGGEYDPGRLMLAPCALNGHAGIFCGSSGVFCSRNARSGSFLKLPARGLLASCTLTGAGSYTQQAGTLVVQLACMYCLPSLPPVTASAWGRRMALG